MTAFVMFIGVVIGFALGVAHQGHELYKNPGKYGFRKL